MRNAVDSLLSRCCHAVVMPPVCSLDGESRQCRFRKARSGLARGRRLWSGRRFGRRLFVAVVNLHQLAVNPSRQLGLALWGDEGVLAAVARPGCSASSGADRLGAGILSVIIRNLTEKSRGPRSAWSRFRTVWSASQLRSILVHLGVALNIRIRSSS